MSWTFVNNLYLFFHFYFYLCTKHKRLNYRRLSTLDYHSKQNLGNIQKSEKLFVCWEVEKKRQQQQKQPAAPKCIKVWLEADLNAASHPPENKLKKKYFPKNDNFVERRKSRKLLLFCLVLMISRDADKKLFDGCNFKSEMFWGKINCWWC